jgi:hypothetical protein
MAKLDPFSAQIVQLVRKMPDEAILALVRGQLGVVTDEAAPVVAVAQRKLRGRRGRPKAAVKAPVAATVAVKAAKKVGRPKKRTSAARQRVLAAVERVVKSSKGLSASEVARATGIGQVRVATALRELKLNKRIHQGGDRRFARYAADSRTAEQASLDARKNAGGPIVKKPARRK